VKDESLALADAGGSRNPLVNALTCLRLICHSDLIYPPRAVEKLFLGKKQVILARRRAGLQLLISRVNFQRLAGSRNEWCRNEWLPKGRLRIRMAATFNRE
jgi:hypothetical protein